MSETENDGEWVEVEGEAPEGTRGNIPSPRETEKGSLTAIEEQLIRELAGREVDLKGFSSQDLTFSVHPKWDEIPDSETTLPRKNSGDALTQLKSGAIQSKRWAGVVVPEFGYIEILIRPNSTPMPPSILMRRFSRIVTEDAHIECEHSSDGRELPRLTFSDPRQDLNTTVLHLAGNNACIEISGPSPACHILANSGWGSRPRFYYSVKVAFGKPMKFEEIEVSAEPLLNSLTYELEVRNNIKIRLVRWPLKSERPQVVRRERASRLVRFPETEIDPEVAVLFGFAGSATGNPPLAFLSYYQVLENFFPMAGRRSALRSLELELADQRFDRHQDKYLMRLLAVGENAASASESSQLRVLLEEFVRGDSLKDFFAKNDWGKHFTKNGPIKGVTENINVENKQLDLSHQVADRVYKIRNRIVHAKDDPKFENMPALLPQSDEAEALEPDIELVRMLAFEVILSVQTRVRR